MQLPDLKSLVSDRRYAAGLGLGISSGLPLVLVYSTQSVWLSKAHVPIETIGLLTELTLAYKLKFLWAPFLYRYDPPVLGRLLGRQRGWIIVTQVAAAVALAGIALGDPAHRLWWTIVFSLMLGLAGANQDIMIDGWRINAVPPERLAPFTSVVEVGWRIGTSLIGGALVLYLAHFYGWRVAYLCMATVMAVGMIATLLAPEPAAAKIAAAAERQTLASALVTPTKELIARLGPMALPILLLVAGFRMPGYIAMAMANPLYTHLGYSEADIATVTKIFSFGTAIGATALGGLIVPRLGMMATLMLGTVAGSASHLALAWLAAKGVGGDHAFWPFAIAVSIDGFAYAFASIVLITYMSTLTKTELAGSQFALLSSLVAIPGSVIAASSGFLVKHLGFTWFFVGTSLIGIPVAVLCWSVARMHTQGAGRTAEDAISP